jgi:hypothetical protein
LLSIETFPFNDWFRDENLQPSLAVPVNDGPDSQSDYNIERSRKRKDYFTGCLPWPQKGTASFIADTGKVILAFTSIIRLRIRTVIDRNSKRRLEVFITKPIVEDKIMRTKWKS